MLCAGDRILIHDISSDNSGRKHIMQRLVLLTVFVLLTVIPSMAQSHTISIEYPALYPEGIEYNFLTQAFLVSSAYEGTVFAVDRKGNIEPFIEDERLIATLGLRVDAARSRLLVLNSDGGTARRSSPDTAVQTAGLGIYDLLTGDAIEYIDLADLVPDVPHFVNDLTIDPDGNIYITDSFTPAIYKVDSTGNPEIFLLDEAFASEGGVGLNGIVYHPDGYLLVAQYTTGSLYKVPLDAPERFELISVEVNIVGADGLLLLDEQNVVVVANATTNQVLWLSSTDHWVSSTLVTSKPTGEVFATTAVQIDETVYVVHGYLDRLVDPDNEDPVTTFEIQPIQFDENGGA